jgi:hypothetical protein
MDSAGAKSFEELFPDAKAPHQPIASGTGRLTPIL